MIAIGSSGYDYDDWKGVFYPERLPRSEWLTYYASRFSALELNFSYYRLPDPGQLGRMVERTGGKVEFSIKAHRSMTHERTASDREYDQFLDAVSELRRADRLGAVLAQFPYSFKQCEESRGYLKRLSDRLGRPLVFEFRRAEWAADPVVAWLERLEVGCACVDEPALPGLMPRRALATASPGYVRFHGRNAARWYEHDNAAERYDYRYTAAELGEWTGRIRELEKQVDKVLVFFNNHFQGKAVDSAALLAKLLFAP